jgi:hypothetical protein
VFSNIRLRGIGFRFVYPTLDQGLRQVLGAVHRHSQEDADAALV